jgi:membrane protease YdiL (CAAX protease family)
MTTSDETTQSEVTGLAKVWQRTPVLVKTIIMIILVGMVGANVFVILFLLLPMPLTPVIALGFLFLYWKFFSGSWGPDKTAEVRKKYSRAGKLSPTLWKWSLLLAVLFVLVVQSSFVVTFRLVEFPADVVLQEFGFESEPLWVAWAIIIIASFSAGLTEEVGFRGYGQVPLEERYGPLVANIIVSVLFVIAHLNQAWALPILLQLFFVSMLWGQIALATGSLLPGIIAHTLLDIVNFAYWWTDVAGKFEYQTIAVTGVDLQFIVWLLIFIGSIALFIWTLGKVKAVRLQS